MELEINRISKKYNRDKYGLRDYSLSLKNGILGLLGPNGAGKSTLMKIIATISKPTEGTITLDGVDIVQKPDTIRKILGYLPQDFGVYPNLNAYEFLEYIAAMKGFGGKNLKERIAQLLEGVNLTDAARKPIGTYSGGMRQRVGIAQVLLNNPKILIFDEPTVGLDPEERVRFRNLIADLATDCIVILSSHIVSDIETIADEVAVMKGGQLIQKGYQKDITDTVAGKIFETEIADSELASFKQRYMVIDQIRRKERLQVRFIAENGAENALACPATLEDAYLYLTKK
ncbi:MAG: ABC transporter ATP-binding protein [Cytophagales bacterium]|nr:MAG: ABC transporter ATP-binding protein [Cytophagales bacterium]